MGRGRRGSDRPAAVDSSSPALQGGRAFAWGPAYPGRAPRTFASSLRMGRSRPLAPAAHMIAPASWAGRRRLTVGVSVASCRGPRGLVGVPVGVRSSVEPVIRDTYAARFGEPGRIRTSNPVNESDHAPEHESVPEKRRRSRSAANRVGVSVGVWVFHRARTSRPPAWAGVHHSDSSVCVAPRTARRWPYSWMVVAIDVCPSNVIT